MVETELQAPLGLALGVAMGILSGMGLGGGKLLVPLLVLAMGVRQQAAQAVSLLAFVPIALSGSWVHARQGRVDVRVVVRFLPAVLAGAAIGAYVANHVDADPLRRAYGLLLVGVALHELWPWARGAALGLRELRPGEPQGPSRMHPGRAARRRPHR